jgi:hypothetical protein
MTSPPLYYVYYASDVKPGSKAPGYLKALGVREVTRG